MTLDGGLGFPPFSTREGSETPPHGLGLHVDVDLLLCHLCGLHRLGEKGENAHIAFVMPVALTATFGLLQKKTNLKQLFIPVIQAERLLAFTI